MGSRVMAGKMEQVAIVYSSRRKVRGFAFMLLHEILQRRKYIKLKQKLFERNGGLLFQKKMSSNEGGLDKAKLFSSKELEIATDQYNENRILGCGGQGMVYKGMLSDGRIVAVKKSKTV
ncbi:hypothetical protein Goshw_012605, partial [Gossypium schwendimanii]|nr:hypothetical protein [Gossypium schwendimanii]